MGFRLRKPLRHVICIPVVEERPYVTPIVKYEKVIPIAMVTVDNGRLLFLWCGLLCRLLVSQYDFVTKATLFCERGVYRVLLKRGGTVVAEGGGSA